MKIGVTLPYTEHLEQDLIRCREISIDTIQLSVPVDCFTDEALEKINAGLAKSGIEISALIANWTGPQQWDLRNGPNTLGIVPTAYQHSRIEQILECGKFAQRLGITEICCHMGFIPEYPHDPAYVEFIPAVTYLVEELGKLNVALLFETGQETPVTLRRALTDINKENTGVNFDPANLMMYGKANPIDAVEILAPYIRGVHMKDGNYPKVDEDLGVEEPLGQGQVNIEAVYKKLKETGYDGSLTIEREISGEKQWHDIDMAVQMIKSFM